MMAVDIWGNRVEDRPDWPETEKSIKKVLIDMLLAGEVKVEEYNIGDFERLVEARDKAEAEFLKALHEDSKIAEYMRDYWKHLSSGAD